MFRHMLFLACLFLLLQIIIGGSIDYRCAANGCRNGAECQPNGQCKCSGTQFGAYCDVGRGCSGTGATLCDAAGTITDGGATKCYSEDAAICICKDGYTGDLCKNKLLHASCDASSMSITIDPHRYSDLADFQGKVHFGTEKSMFDDLKNIKGTCTVGTTFPHTFDAFASKIDCGVPNPVNKKITYYVYVQHNKQIKSVEDQILEVICDYSSSASVSIVNTIVESSTEVQQTTISKVDDVTMKIRKDAGADLHDFQVHDTVNVNDNIALTLESPAMFLIKSCQVTDGTSSNVIKVIDVGCVDNEGLLLFSSKIIAFTDSPKVNPTDYTNNGLTGAPNKYAVKLPLKAVKFTTGSKLEFSCELCTEASCNIARMGCEKNLHIGSNLEDFQHTIYMALRRRKRSVTNGTVGTSISVALTINEYKELLKEANESKETECFKSAVVLLPLILLASLLVIAMGMTFFFCNKFTQNMTEGQSNIGFKA